MLDAFSFRMLLAAPVGWLDQRQQDAVAYLIEENHLRRGHVRGRIRLTDEEHAVGWPCADTDWAVAASVRSRRSSRPTQFCAGIGGLSPASGHMQRSAVVVRVYSPRSSGLVVRMAAENPTWGYTRIVGALKNVGHRVSRSSIARILKAHGIPPVPERPTSWQTFLQAHWGAIAGADLFTTEVWTWRGLVTYYTVFFSPALIAATDCG